jgi:hypothetical protein
VTQFVALERNAEKGIPNHMAEAYRAWRAGRLEEFYAPLVVGDDELERGLADGSLAYDTRLRDALRSLGFGEGGDGALSAARDFGRLDVSAAAQYAAESTALLESDVAVALAARIEELEGRVGGLERGALTRLRSAARRGRRR